MRTIREMPERSAPWVLAVGDALALLAFVLVGLTNHRSGVTAEGIARNLGPILAVWAAAALAFGAYRRPGLRTFVLTWAVSVPVAVSLRALWLGHPTGSAFVTFLAVTFAMTLIFVGGWRLLSRVVLRRGPRAARSSG
jgi:hypothetical protein